MQSAERLMVNVYTLKMGKIKWYFTYIFQIHTEDKLCNSFMYFFNELLLIFINLDIEQYEQNLKKSS